AKSILLPMVALISLVLSAILNFVADLYTKIAGVALDIGGALIGGLVSAIFAGVPRVGEAIKSLGSSAIASLKSVLGIHSPSKVFRIAGAYSAEGFAMGLEEGTAGAQVASRGLAQAASSAAQPGPAPRRASTGEKRGVEI